MQDIISAALLQEHGALIYRVVMSINEPGSVTDLPALLGQAKANGWDELVAAIERILDGERDLHAFPDLDDEDSAIVHAILRALEDPTLLPDLAYGMDSAAAARELATLIIAVRCGNTQAQRALSQAAQHFASLGGDLAGVAQVLAPLVNGERDLPKLVAPLGQAGAGIVSAIVQELQQREN